MSALLQEEVNLQKGVHQEVQYIKDVGGLPRAIVAIGGAFIFPEFHAIEHMGLIRLWIAQGFVIGEGGKTLEEVAESYLKEHLDRSLLQVVEKTSDSRMKTCQMHDVLREIINLKSKD
ncbi:hypothetical protein PIB30_040062 [Stylosanthes scabra]|uniref:Disease resistance protein winged helix domain-containing protein n=1 Tax=Stylosanthes scabra TaxID=79078 RepID=A0ABU6VE17_9FABA|nr:hypothetical protein [Stylosanthes scabra]